MDRLQFCNLSWKGHLIRNKLLLLVMDDELSNLLNNLVITDVSQVYWNKEIKRVVIFKRVDEIFRIVIFNNNSGELERKIAEPIQGWNEWETCSNQNKSEIGQLIRNFNWHAYA